MPVSNILLSRFHRFTHSASHGSFQGSGEAFRAQGVLSFATLTQCQGFGTKVGCRLNYNAQNPWLNDSLLLQKRPYSTAEATNSEEVIDGNHGTASEITPVIPRAALILGIAGLIPFVAGAIGGYTMPPQYVPQILSTQMMYASLILSFLGGPHWGLAMSKYSRDPVKPYDLERGLSTRYAVAVAPSLVALATVFFHPHQAMLGLMVGHIGMFVADAWADKKAYVPRWYMHLRTPLTLVAVASLAASWFIM